MPEKTTAMLVLEDGSAFTGVSMGAQGEFVGEVVFNTSMTGYQEIITDPSYWGQMVCFTCPHIGNVGINGQDVESKQPYVRAVIARQICAVPSSWRSEQALPAYLAENGVPALSGIDTRRLTLLLREKGVLRGVISTESMDMDYLLARARGIPDMSELTPVSQVSRDEDEAWNTPVAGEWQPVMQRLTLQSADSPHVVVIDCGIKSNILRLLTSLGARVTVVPADTSAEAILSRCPDGVLISNGPGDPEQAPATIDAARQLMGKTPLFGICLGHQIIGMACGARKYKLLFGHHGGNHPVQDLATGKVEITAQNHNYAIAADSMKGLPLEITHLNLYDGTVEGLRHTQLPVWSIQYHPEASPGPHDSLGILQEFVQSLKAEQSTE